MTPAKTEVAITGTTTYLYCYIVPSSRVRLLVITMIIFLHAFRYLAGPHNSMSVQFVTALMSSSQRARGLAPFLVPPPIPNIIHFFQTIFSSHDMSEI